MDDRKERVPRGHGPTSAAGPGGVGHPCRAAGGKDVDDVVREMYADLDRVFAERIVRGRPVTCDGCRAAHCCYLLALTTIPEALYIASQVARWPDWRAWVSRLALAARAVATCTDRGEWFERHIPCPFLAGDSTCLVYERRPGCCRWHSVQSPVANCASGAADDTILRYDSSALDEAAVHFAQEFHESYPAAGELGVGPIPLAVLHALALIAQGKTRRYVEKKLRGLPTLREWSERWHAARPKALPVVGCVGGGT